MAVAVTETVLGVFPAFSSTIPDTSKVSVPVSHKESAVWPAGYCKGKTPMPIKFER